MNEQIPSAESILNAKHELADKILRERTAGVEHFDSLRAVTDPTITPFLMALKAEGYSIKIAGGGCVVTENCPSCRSPHRYTFFKNGIGHKRCALCTE